MRSIEYMVIVAGPTACGKTTLLQAISAGRLPEIAKRAGIENPREWKLMESLRFRRSTDLVSKNLVLQLDLIWAPYTFDDEPPGERTVAQLFDGVREVFFITVWTPPVRLERQFLASRLCAPVPPNWGGILRGRAFQLLPRFAIRGLSRLPLWKTFNRWLPGTAIFRGLLAERIYSSPAQLIALYRRWFELCDEQRSKTRGHLIVEYDGGVRTYTRAEWESWVTTDRASR
jgi:hypothetical protein